MYNFFKSIVNFLVVIFVKVFTKNKAKFSCNIHPNTFIYLLKNKISKINFDRAYIGGNKVELSKGNIFYENPILFGNIKIGKYTAINGPATRICSGVHYVEIGAYCSIASNVIIQEYYHNTDLVTTYGVLSNVLKLKDYSIQKVSKGPIIIGDDVWVGSNVVILSGVKIGRGAIIGAGSVVTKDVLPYTINAGNPCKFVRNRFSESDIIEIEKSKWWLWDENKMKQNENFFTKVYNLNDK